MTAALTSRTDQRRTVSARIGTILRVDDECIRTVAIFKLIQTLDQLEERARVLHLAAV